MSKIANRDARDRVGRREPFTGSNTFGAWVHLPSFVGVNDDNNLGVVAPRLYIAYSYGTHWPLYIWDEQAQRWFENVSKFSRTTAKHRGQLRPCNDGTETTECDVETMKAIARYGLTGFITNKFIAEDLNNA